MSGSAARHPVAMMGGAGLLAGAVAVNVIASPALVALAASLLTAAALAPMIVGAGPNGGEGDAPGDWAGRLMARASGALGRRWPGLRLQSGRDRRQRVFAFLAGLNVAVFASFFLRGGG